MNAQASRKRPVTSHPATPTPIATISAPIGTPESAWRIRRDTWEHLGYVLAQLANTHAAGAGTGLPGQARRDVELLQAIEPYWAIPGEQFVRELADDVTNGRYPAAVARVEEFGESMRSSRGHHQDALSDAKEPHDGPAQSALPFEVLVLDSGPSAERRKLVDALESEQRPSDTFTYRLNFVGTAEDALVALIINPSIQACILTPRFASSSEQRLSTSLRDFVRHRLPDRCSDDQPPIDRIVSLAAAIACLRPEIDLYLLAGAALETLAGALNGQFRRIFARTDALDLHLSLLGGIAERYRTPFFTALQDYARQPGGVFHAMPISRAGSVRNSPWINDFEEFYGMNLLLAETSATSGGLDSLLDPHGSIRDAQSRASSAFGSRHTFFVTNGTSTANKVVHQAVIAPGDIVLVDRNCHKSHHYGLVLAGAHVIYLEAYSIGAHSLYGAVATDAITEQLRRLRDDGLLDRVTMLALTNCTFDGIVYDPRRVMEACLAIKPDLVFLWDEAWFGFARFHPVYRQRTAMHAAQELKRSFADPDYIGRRQADADRTHPDPARARIRVYSTQSTHKTLTSLRQGSMIHIFDQDFETRTADAFREAFMTHTSTSPNYQILASLDIGRRQAELEGYPLIQRQVDLANTIRRTVARHPLLRRYFRILAEPDLLPPAPSGHRHVPLKDGLAGWDQRWAKDEFVIDPSRLTLDISATGIDGDAFKHHYLMDQHRIQVNKTSRSSVLLMTNIGTSRSSVAYLIEVLVKIAEDLDQRGVGAESSGSQRRGNETPALPHFSAFHPAFSPDGRIGDVRSAFYLAYRSEATTHLSSVGIRKVVAAGHDVVSAGFVTPYPPGFPVLVPGQLITERILDYMDALDTREIHGYDSREGYRIFTDAALNTCSDATGRLNP